MESAQAPDFRFGDFTLTTSLPRKAKERDPHVGYHGGRIFENCIPITGSS